MNYEDERAIQAREFACFCHDCWDIWFEYRIDEADVTYWIDLGGES